MTRTYTQEDREELLEGTLGETKTYFKKARIVATRISEDFVVYTDRGPMQGHSGDYLVTNHPEDDTDSDIWTISEERMRSTYEELEQ